MSDEHPAPNSIDLSVTDNTKVFENHFTEDKIDEHAEGMDVASEHATGKDILLGLLILVLSVCTVCAVIAFLIAISSLL